MQAHVQLDRGLGAADACPGKELQGQADLAGIQRIQRGVEAEAVRTAVLPTGQQQALEQRFEKRAGLLTVEASQRTAGDGADPDKGQEGVLNAQVGFDVAQALAAAELRHEQRGELIPATGLAQGMPGIVLPGKRIEHVPWHVLQKLGEDGARLRHGLGSSAFTTVSGENAV